ncbi:NAD(P)/FAD-dependent oxidoreductase [Pantanalinema rosaneae CENA516]|uniref:NAD(P)/FAD-dependent oxidoreductase n=1 Tax=Pantanalinema rosaneae TaxID=1620701 RepID=UPI003D6E8D73
MTKVVIIGCGVIGAAIAYELSQVPGLTVTVCDRETPAQAATGAALGVLMGAISQKAKGRKLQMRLSSIQRYNTWIPQLEQATGHKIPFNQQGILRLCFEGEDLASWRSLQEIRQQQGWRLQILDRAQLQADYPQLNLEGVIAGIYSPDDRQLDPTVLTKALVAAATQNGVTFHFHTTVTGIDRQPTSDSSLQRCDQVQTSKGAIAADWCVIAAGLGSTPFTEQLHQPVEIRPVLGQAMQVRLDQPMGHPDLQPAINGNDTHIVPLGNGAYWLGATVEFPTHSNSAALQPDPTRLETVRQTAIALCPAFSTATVQRTWFGLRPRPEGRPAPVIELLPGYHNILLATGHYRNGILLAPATAAKVREAIGVA